VEAFGRIAEGLERCDQVADEPDEPLESRRRGGREAHPFRLLDGLVQTSLARVHASWTSGMRHDAIPA